MLLLAAGNHRFELNVPHRASGLDHEVISVRINFRTEQFDIPAAFDPQGRREFGDEPVLENLLEA